MRRLKKGDILISAFFLILAGAVFFSGMLRPSGRLTAIITQNGKEIRRIELSGLTSPVTITVSGEYENVIKADQSGVWVEHATCPRQTCVHTGKLTKAGSCAVCMENKMVVTLVGDGGFDAVAG